MSEATVSLPYTNIGQFVVNALTSSWNPDYMYFIDDVQYTFTPAGGGGQVVYYLNLNDFTTGSSAVTRAYKEVAAGDNVTAHAALGTVFSLSATKKSDASDALLTLSTPTASISPALRWPGVHLWADKNLLFLGTDDQGRSTFLAVHEGTAKMDVTIAGEAKLVHLTLNVVQATDLGNVENDWDSTINEAGNERGIPPRLLKGQLAQESSNGKTFSVYNFRYEPCTSDYSKIDALLSTFPYDKYVLDAARDDGTFDNDFLADSLYTLSIPTAYSTAGIPIQRANIGAADRGVPAKDIVKAMNEWPVGSGHGMRWIWQHPRRSCNPYWTWFHYNYPANVPSSYSTISTWLDQTFNFVAQPTMASSFGAFQVLYTTALEDQWQVTLADGTIDWNPKYLFDTSANHQLSGGGSVMAGSEHDAKDFLKRAGTPASFSSRDAFDSAMSDMFQDYNSGWQGYGAGVMDFAKLYVTDVPLSFE